MSTSLQEQLQRLAVPQTMALADSRSKASVLFDRKEAGTKTRRIIFEIGLAGLQELTAINPVFQSFENTLFNESTMDLERSVEEKDVNKLLDRNINKFLQNLSPYFLLRPTLMCLEWLIRRFHVQEYNRNALLALALPYHETGPFILVLQVIRIKQSDTNWNWLRPLQRSGVPVPKTAIINRAATDAAFLKFICQSILDAVKELGTRANSLQTQLNFYASVVVGALEHTSTVAEWHIITILPSLLKGLQSEMLDFASAAYIVATQLVARTQVTSKLCNTLVERAAAVTHERLRQTAVLFLIFLFDSQKSTQPHFSEASLLNLATQKWFTRNLANLAKENVYVHALYVALLQQAISDIQAGHQEADILKDFLERLLYDVQLNADSSKEIINAFLNSYDELPLSSPKKYLQDGDMIELSSDDEMEDENNCFRAWYSEYLRKLERKYPVTFDQTIKEGLTSNSQEFARKRGVLKMALGFRLKTFDPSATDIYEQLYHHSAKIRAFAVQTLLANLNDYSARPQNMHLLRECLADRISDDSELVAKEILKLPTKEFVLVLGADKIAEALIGILNKVQQDPQHWAPLAAITVRHFTNAEIVANYDTNIILLALMPLLFPDKNNDYIYNAIAEILKSPLCAKIGFLKELKLVQQSSDFNAVEFKQQFLDVASKSAATPTSLDLFRSVESHGESLFKNALNFSHILILATACLKTELTGAEAGYIFQQIRTNYRRFRIRQLKNKDLMMKKQCLPLQLFSDFIITLAQHTHFEHLFEWEQIYDDLRTFLSILNLLSDEGFNPRNSDQQIEWLKTLKEVFDGIFDNAQLKLEFLSNFYVYESNEAVGVEYPLLRLRAFKITNYLLKNKNNKLQINTSHVFRIASALNAPSETTRLQSLETLKVLKENIALSAHLTHFVDSILARSYEFSMDHEQFPLILYTILKANNKKPQPESLKVLREIVQLVTAPKALEHAGFTAQILKTLKHISGASLLADLIPLGVRTLEKTQMEDALLILPQPYSTILRLICDRFESQTIENLLLDQPDAWRFVEKIFGEHKVFILHGNKLRSLPCVLLEAFDEHCYEQMPQNYKIDLIKLIVATMATSETDAVFLSANRLLKRCSIKCAPFVELLKKMYRIDAATAAANSAKRKTLASQATVGGAGKRNEKSHNNLSAQVNTVAWKQGVALLELLEHKKRLKETEQLLAPLFELLRFCLEFEEQTVVEYTKQLTLTTLLHSCHLAQAAGIQLAQVLPKSTFRIDLIVQCVRGTQNPQTQNNALLLLSHCAAIYPQQVLHSVVDVFTFMGSSVVRHDDAFSFHIINNVIESIIPILVRSQYAKGGDRNSTALVIPVLKVFSDILLDVPEHRRLPLYSKLLLTLGAERYLAIFLCIVFEAHVLEDEKQRLLQRKNKNDKRSGTAAATEKFSKRLEICLDLTNTFDPQITLETCIELLSYISSLPVDKQDDAHDKVKVKKTQEAIDSTEACLFDVKCRTAKQLRHYKYVIMQFLSSISNSPEFLRKIALFSDAEQLAIKPYYQNFIIKTLSYVPMVNTAIENAEETSQIKYWKVILHHLHDVLDSAISLLSPDMFLVVIHGLMQHQLVSIRKKVIELLINKLQQRDNYFDNCNSENFYNLLQPLSEIIAGIITKHETPDTSGTASPSSSSTNELVFLQQTALIAIKLLSKMFALQHINEFKEILAHLIKVLKQRSQISKIVLATVVLTIIEISSNLKAHSLAMLPKYMPQMIDILQDQAKLVQAHPPDNVCIAIITGTQKLFESLPLFLGPYVVDVITALSTISANISAQQYERDQRATTALHRITTIWSKIASDVPVRILVPSCEKAYRKLMAAHNYADIGVLMELLPECINKTASTDLSAVQSELGAFFLHILEFRLHARGNWEHERVACTEKVIIDAFVTWVLKLSETSFRPYYQKVYEWAIKQRAQRETIYTFFSLTNKIADALKSLFLLFARDFIDDAANFLNEYNTTRQSIDADVEPLTADIVKSILSTLYILFLHDSKGFINSQRFEMLMQPLVDQLENRLVLESEELQQSLQTCLAQLAAAVSNDIMWKQLNYQVLMKTRTNVPEVRILSFNCCLEIARKLGEDFTPLLPETVPFVAELLEDENQRVEKNTRKAVQELENILGESLQSYL